MTPSELHTDSGGSGAGGWGGAESPAFDTLTIRTTHHENSMIVWMYLSWCRCKSTVILPTLNWIWGHPQALIQRMHFWSPCFGLVKGTNRIPSHDSRYLLSELQVPHAQCFTGIFFLFYKYLASFPAVSMYPQQKRAYSALHPQALTSAFPWISEDGLTKTTECTGVLPPCW